MSKVIALVVGASLAWASALAADTFNAEGVVNAVKAKENKLTITHGPINGLMGGMTMDFNVLDPSMLDNVRAGSKIRFILIKDSQGNLVVSDLESVTTAKK